MTKKKLMELIAHMPDDAVVIIYQPDDGGLVEAVGVTVETADTKVVYIY